MQNTETITDITGTNKEPETKTKEISLGHVPSGSKWEFDGSVTNVFGDMLERSIPEYKEMRSAVFSMAQSFIRSGTYLVDLGCSNGLSLENFIHSHGSDNKYLGVECSEPMINAARTRYKELIDMGLVDIQNLDLRTDYPNVLASVTLCVLTLQFTPIEYRQRIVKDIYKHTTPGGALILVEKILGDTSDINALMVRNYYAMKSRNGYSQEEIDRKRLSLEGVLVPVTARWNEEILRNSGFKQVDCFWRWMNFAGWIAIKD